MIEEIQEKIADKRTRHWMAWSRIYKIFCDMKYRCSEKSKWMNRKHYFLKWITVVRDSFDCFLADMYKPYKELSKEIWESNVSIERIDYNRNYCKDNCKRVHIKEQSNNKSNNIYYTYSWITDTLAWWWRRLDIKKPTLWRRLLSWRSPERVFSSHKQLTQIVLYNWWEYTARELSKVIWFPVRRIYRMIERWDLFLKKL